MLRDNGRDSVGMDNAADLGNRQLTVMQDISGDKPVLSRHNPLADTATVYRPAGISFKAVQRRALSQSA